MDKVPGKYFAAPKGEAIVLGVETNVPEVEAIARGVETNVPEVEAVVQAFGTIVPGAGEFSSKVGEIVPGVVFLRFFASSLLKLTLPEGRLIVCNLGFGIWNFLSLGCGQNKNPPRG
jgi:hypothetical protein